MHPSAAFLTTLAALPVASAHLQKRLDNGLALTPPMGWNSYNHYNCQPNQSIILSNAEALVTLGLADLGYNYVTTDCGWTIPHRTPNNTLIWNATLFPDGFPSMGQRIHDLGLGFGVYSDGGVQMCMTNGVNQTGSLGHEDTDAATFVSWGADLLKYDNCFSSAERGFPNVDYAPLTSPRQNYVNMQSALNKTGKNLLFQICDWGVDFPSLWAPELGNTWRITNDIIPAWKTIFRIVNQAVPSTSFAGPGHWLDLDMLEIGNEIFTHAEEKTHFSLWSILKSPLTIGCALNDTLTSINKASLDILKNERVIAVNQDTLGVAATLRRRWSEQGYDVWSGPLSGNRTVAALVNWNNFAIDVALDLPDIGLQSAGWTRDLWSNETRSHVQTSYKTRVEAHDTLLLELGDTLPVGVYELNGQSGNITVENVYGLTTSSDYTLHLSFPPSPHSHDINLQTTHQKTHHHIPKHITSTSLPLHLFAGNNNTLQISTTQPISSLKISLPPSKFYPSPSFSTSGTAKKISCPSTLCLPSHSKIANLSSTSFASLTLPAHSPEKKYIEITYINNDIAFSSAWGNGRNARNITVSVNNVTTRLEVPLSGRSSEIFGVMGGWGDSAVLGVLVGGWKGQGTDLIEVGNVDGEEGEQRWGAEFVGLRVFG